MTDVIVSAAERIPVNVAYNSLPYLLPITAVVVAYGDLLVANNDREGGGEIVKRNGVFYLWQAVAMTGGG